jgi:hypothetical protein
MRFVFVLMALTFAGQVSAQYSHGDTGAAMVGPNESGQAAFAALAEIVAILRDEPETDWDSVDIAGLRRHLVDMDLLTTDAEVISAKRPMGAHFEIRGTPRVLEAVRTMVPAHAPFLAAETGWEVSTEEFDDRVILIVDGDAAQIQGLGFFGMMAIGAHHQEHHELIARGHPAHE